MGMWIVIGIVVFLLLFVIGIYNRLITLRTRLNEAFSDWGRFINQKAKELVNLVATVKAYAAHEKSIFTDVAKVRTAPMTIDPSKISDIKSFDNQITGALKTVFAVAEAYPDLRANENFLQNQTRISELQDKITSSEMFYNGTVREYDTYVNIFPSNIVAKMFGFKPVEFIVTDEETRKDNVKVDYTQDK